MDRFLRLNNEEASWIKNNIRDSKNTFGNILRHMLEYQSLRNREVAQKNKLKVSMTQLKTKINQMESTLPEEERKNAYNQMYEKEKGTRRIHHIIDNRPMHTMQHHEIPRHLSHIHRMILRDQTKHPGDEIEEIRRKLEEMNR